MESYVGVSGFSYASWKGRFYPDDLKAEEFLRFYAGKLGSVEVNSSFYAAPSAAMVKSWAAKTPEGFRFAFKAPRLITHIRKLGGGASDAALRLSDTVGLLGPRRGPILFQLPPYSRFDRDLLDAFLSSTVSIEPKVFEFRHDSWLTDATYRVLEDHGAGFCVADTEDRKPVFMVTGDTAYFRLRKEAYDQKSIGDWAGKISEVAKGARECYIFLRHDETGENAVLAQGLAEKLQEE